MLKLLYIRRNSPILSMLYVCMCILLLTFALVGCKSEVVKEVPNSSPSSALGLDSVQQQGVLNAIVEASPHAYYLYKGYPSGYTYEMLKSFASYLEVDLNIIVSHSLTESLSLLQSGRANVLAEGLAITSQRKNEWLFGPDLMRTQQILVQRLPKAWRNIATLDEINTHLCAYGFCICR